MTLSQGSNIGSFDSNFLIIKLQFAKLREKAVLCHVCKRKRGKQERKEILIFYMQAKHYITVELKLIPNIG